jgi:dolichyl-diphosphooligosaccharide--protein glycosyltransferase/undecaprenyl-diphosphooligosaccharide--protein glycosyltransferase
MKIELNEKHWTIIGIALAYIFAIAMRLIWVNTFNDQEAFKFNGEFILTNSDGFFFATIARDIMEGLDIGGQPFIGYTIAFFYKILPFSFETIIFYIPIFLGSLIVIPIFLIAKELHSKETGLLASLIGGIAVSYYNRTMVGYLDTDMLNVVFPTFLLYFIIKGFLTYQWRYLALSAITVVAYMQWYASAYSILLAFCGILFLFFIYQYFKEKNKNSYYYLKMLISVALALASFNLPFLYQVVVIAIVLYIFSKNEYDKYIWYVLLVSLALAIYTDFFGPIIAQMKKYIFKGNSEINSTKDGLQLQFFNVINTVKEAQAIPFETFAKRVSGDINVFVISVVGMLFLLFKRPIFLLSLPLIVVGMIAYGIPGLIPPGGLRFTVYLVPIAAIGLGFLIVFISQKVSNEKKIIFYPLLAIFISLSLMPNIQHIVNYKIPTVLTSVEAQQLDRLKKVVNKDDYIISWWDYGYQIEYYTGAKTFGNGGKNSGESNFYLSFMLTQNQPASAKMARLYTEILESKNSEKSPIEHMAEGYRIKDINKFVQALKSINMDMPTKTRDVYYYLPSRMIDIYNVIEQFSNRDLVSGKQHNPNPFVSAKAIKQDKNIIYFTNSVAIDIAKNIIYIGNKSIPINTIFIKKAINNKLDIRGMKLNKNAQLYAMYDLISQKIVISNPSVFKSLYFQLYMLGAYNNQLFEPIETNYYGNIYKLKF